MEFSKADPNGIIQNFILVNNTPQHRTACLCTTNDCPQIRSLCYGLKGHTLLFAIISIRIYKWGKTN